MKITVDMTQIHAAPELGRVAAVALLCALPQDEAELAIDEWRAVLGVRKADADAAIKAVIALGDVETTGIVDVFDVATTTAEVTTLYADVTTPSAETAAATLAKFTYGGRTFSARKGGPAAAYRQALEDVATCATIEELDALQPKLDALGGIFTKVGHPDRVDGLREAVSRWRSEIHFARVDEPLVVENIEDTIPLPPEAPAVFDQTVEPTGVKSVEAPHSVAVTNGSTDPLHAMSLRELCRHAEHEVGRDAVIEAMRRHNVTKLAGLEADAEAALRAAVMELLA